MEKDITAFDTDGYHSCVSLYIIVTHVCHEQNGCNVLEIVPDFFMLPNLILEVV